MQRRKRNPPARRGLFSKQLHVVGMPHCLPLSMNIICHGSWLMSRSHREAAMASATSSRIEVMREVIACRSCLLYVLFTRLEAAFLYSCHSGIVEKKYGSTTCIHTISTHTTTPTKRTTKRRRKRRRGHHKQKTTPVGATRKASNIAGRSIHTSCIYALSFSCICSYTCISVCMETCRTSDIGHQVRCQD